MLDTIKQNRLEDKTPEKLISMEMVPGYTFWFGKDALGNIALQNDILLPLVIKRGSFCIVVATSGVSA